MECTINLGFYLDFDTTVFSTSGNITIYNFSPNVFSVTGNVLINNVNYFNFDVMFNNDPTSISSFQIIYTCEAVDEESLSVSYLTELDFFRYDNNGLYTYIYIHNLKYHITPVLSTDYSITYGYDNGVFLVHFPFKNTLPGSNYTFDILFVNKNFRVSIPPYFKPMDQSISVIMLPDDFSPGYTKLGYSLSPMLFVNSNLKTTEGVLTSIRRVFNVNENDLPPVKLSASVDGSNCGYVFPISLNEFNITFIYSNGSGLENLNYILDYLQPTYSNIPLVTINKESNYFTATMDTNSEPYSAYDKEILYSYGILNYQTAFPFGFTEGNLDSFKFSASFLRTIRNNSFLMKEYYGGQPQGEEIPGTGASSTDFTPPVITYYDAKYIGNSVNYLITIDFKDDSLISRLTFGSLTIGAESLASGTLSQGRLEFTSSLFGGSMLMFYDSFDNLFYKGPNEPLYLNSNKKIVFFNKPSQPKVSISMIQDLQFLENNIDVLNKPNYNIIYFRSNQISPNSSISFTLSYDSLNLYSFQYNRTSQLFYCKFIVPANIELGKHRFSIAFSEEQIIDSLALNSSLNIISSHFDNDGPIVTAIENANNFQKIGWVIEISDHANGLDTGFIKAVGSVDGSTYKFNFTSKDVVSGNSNLGIYHFYLEMPTPCIPQDYTITFMFLNDKNGISSFYKRNDGELNNQPYKNSLRNFMTDLSALSTSSEVLCFADFSPSIPIINSIDTVDPLSQIDVGSNNRDVLVSFTASDSVGLHPYSNPVVYLLGENSALECEAKPTTPVTTSATYSCKITLPYAFGLPNSRLLLSIYGIVNLGGKFRGYSSFDLNDVGLPSYIPISFNISPILLSYERYFSPGTLTVYGKALGDTASILVKTSEGNEFYVTPTIIGSTILSIPIEFETDKPFDIVALDNKPNSQLTNTLTIVPTFFNASNIISTPTPSTPQPTSTPSIPSNSSKCLGNPLCGGKDHGYCDNNLGCICYSPWTGYDCLSKVIIVPQPSFNTTDPVIEIPINTDNSESNSDSDDISSSAIYKSIVSLYGIRELNINNEPIKTFRFESWIFDQVDKYTSIYRTNIITSEKNVSIIATLKWYENETTINFANKNLTMLPSSIKYTIQIENYPFTVKVNTLELIMFASFESSKNKDICSLKDFSTSPDEQSDYLKIQIENKSFYGRFIKRAIIDNNKTVLLSNQLLDSSMNTINTPNQVQSFIGISIPYFESKVFIDPDFSVIINPHSVSSSSSNSKCTNNNKLSNTKIAGIVIGCVAFVAVITVSIIYAIHKKKENKLFRLNVENKLKNFNSNQN